MQSEGSTKGQGPSTGVTSVRQMEQETTDSSSKSVTQAGTQTSPEGTTTVKGRFSMGSVHSTKEERLSPKLTRKGDRNLKGRGGKRAVSPSPAPVPTARERIIPREFHFVKTVCFIDFHQHFTKITFIF